MTDTAITDQIKAATREAAAAAVATSVATMPRTPWHSRVLSKWAHGLAPGQVHDRYSPHDWVRWIDGQLVHLDHDWTTCGHLPSPQICFGLADMPGHLMCGPCWLAAAEQSEDACDWCGGKADDRTTLWPMICAADFVLVLYVLCDSHLVADASFQHGDIGEYVRHTIRTHNGLSGADSRPPVK